MASTIRLEWSPRAPPPLRGRDEVVLPRLRGEFGVLPGHTQYLAILNIGMLATAGGTRPGRSPGGGFAEVTPERIVVMVDTAERAEEIDIEPSPPRRDRAEAASGAVAGRQRRTRRPTRRCSGRWCGWRRE